MATTMWRATSVVCADVGCHRTGRGLGEGSPPKNLEDLMTRGRHLLWITALLLFVIPATSLGQAPITDDAFVSSATPTSNNGTSPSLVVQAPGGKSFIRFYLSRIPTGAVTSPVTSSMVAKATVKLYVTAVTATGSFDVYRVAATWSEKTITYNTAPPLGPQLATGIAVSTATKYVIVDITQVVKDWLDCLNNNCSIGQPNNGIVLQPTTGSSISVTFESKESTTTSHDPELNVVLTGPVGPQGPQGIQGVVGPQGPVGPAPVAGTGITVTPGQNNTATVALDQTYANGIYAQKSGNNTFSGTNTFNGITDLSHASATLPVHHHGSAAHRSRRVRRRADGDADKCAHRPTTIRLQFQL